MVYKLHNFIVSLIAPYKLDIKDKNVSHFTSEHCSNVKYPITKHLSPYRKCKKKKKEIISKPHISKLVLKKNGEE